MAIRGWRGRIELHVWVGNPSLPSMKHCVCYSHYSLKGDKIGDAGAQALAEGLQHCFNLQKLK